MLMTDKIDAFIKHKGLKGRREFAELCGIPYPTVTSFFSHGYGNAGRETLNKMKIVMGLSLDELADDKIDVDFDAPTRNIKAEATTNGNETVGIALAHDGIYSNYLLHAVDFALVKAFIVKSDIKKGGQCGNN